MTEYNYKQYNQIVYGQYSDYIPSAQHPITQATPHNVDYIHSIFTHFISGVADYIRQDLFPRANDTIISTHNKAVEMVRTRKNLAHENWSPKFPFLVVQPNLDMKPDPLIGRLTHAYPNFQQHFASKLYKNRLYEDDNIYIAPVLNRYVGTIDCTLWCSSLYESIDQKINFIQMFGNEGSYIYPRNIDCLLILPDSLEKYTYKNNYTEEEYQLDWSNTLYAPTLIRNLNQNKLSANVNLKPYLKLNSIDANGDAFGGSGNSISDYSVNANLEWECNIPTHLILVEKKMPIPSVPITIRTNHKFSYITNPVNIEETINFPDEIFDSSVIDVSGSPTQVEQKFLLYHTSENYIITENDVNKFKTNKNLYLTPNVEITDSRYIRAHAKYGWLDEPVHYDIKDGKIVLYGQNLKSLIEGDIITFAYYRDHSFIE